MDDVLDHNLEGVHGQLRLLRFELELEAELQVEVEERLQACPKPLMLSWMARPAPAMEPLPRGRPELRLQDASPPILKSQSWQALKRHPMI